MVAPVVNRTRHTLALRLQCRKEWVQGQGTLAQIARKHGIPRYTMIAWYRRDRWGAARKRWYEKQLSDSEPPTKPQSYAPNPKITTNAHAEMLEQLRLQLAAIDNRIDNEKSALELQRLCAAQRNLFEQWCVLAQIPKPGSRRSGKERRQRDNISPHDMPMPDPVPVSCGVAEPVEPNPVEPNPF